LHFAGAFSTLGLQWRPCNEWFCGAITNRWQHFSDSLAAFNLKPPITDTFI
jgi:hypothetical protein